MLFRLDHTGKVNLVPRADGSVSVVLDIALPGVYKYGDELELVEEDVLNDPAYLLSLSNGVVCNDHPNEPVTADNVKQYNDGNLGETVQPSKDGGPISAPAIIRDAKLLNDVMSGKKKQVSAGYSVELDTDPTTSKGVHPKYGRFTRRQKRRISNHVAIVAQARHGVRARVRTDSAGNEWSEQIDPNEGQTMLVSPELRARLDALGVAKDCTDPVVIAAALLKADTDAKTALAAEKARADAAEGARAAADLAKTKAEADLATEKKARADAAAAPLRLDAFAEAAPLVARAQVLGVKVEGTAADLRKAIVLKVYPEARKDASDDYYSGFLANEKPADPYKVTFEPPVKKDPLLVTDNVPKY